MSTIRIERAPLDTEWDSRSRRVIAEIPIFFPRWREHESLKAVSTEVFWVRAGKGAAEVRRALCSEVLADPLLGVSDQRSVLPVAAGGGKWWCLEKALRPGVTDNAGHVLAEAVKLVANEDAECRSGSRLWLCLPESVSRADVQAYANDVFHNALIERVDVWTFEEARTVDDKLFAEPAWVDVKSGAAETAVETFEIGALSLDELERLSTDRLWALTRDELACVKTHYAGLKRAMTDVEIEVIAQTWSEHCKHKIFAANISVANERDDLEVPARVESVFKTYIRGATRKVPAPYLKSVFEDNAGVIKVTDEWDCAIKVETHNSPSALDPYGGALTGIVGVNRDILGVGLGAHPIANLDVFCVGPLDVEEPLPPRLHHPRRILEGVRVGVEHGGNKSGIPTVTGAVVHHPGYLGKPLVFCGTIGLIPTNRDFITKEIRSGDKIVMAGGRIGKDGIHGATFSSLEMNESSPVSAVQLGDPLTQRRVWDFLIEARDRGLFRAVTDNGAGGLSSSIGELARLCGAKGGARMDVGLAKTKYPGLKPFELTVSESQERMSFAVQPERLEEFLALAARRGVECSVLGEFEDTGRFHVQYHGKTVAELDMHFLHEGLPAMELQARIERPAAPPAATLQRYGQWQELGAEATRLDLRSALLSVLSLPNVRTRRPVVEQYDHEVQARSVRKPYGTPNHLAPNDGATLRLSRTSYEGVALGIGMAPFAATIDPKVATELALDEALRNAAVAGMDPSHASLVDNFCWPDPLPSPSNPDALEKLGALVTTCQRLYDGAVELEMPFVSGKDSMKNDYRMGNVKISVPPTLLITTMGKVHDVRTVPRGHALGAGRHVVWVSGQEIAPNALGLPQVEFSRTKRFLKALHALIGQGLIESAHDVSDGGWLVATAEMLLGTGFGAALKLSAAPEWTRLGGEPEWAPLFGEPATSFVLHVADTAIARVKAALTGFKVLSVGQTIERAELNVAFAGLSAAWSVRQLEDAYTRTEEGL